MPFKLLFSFLYLLLCLFTSTSDPFCPSNSYSSHKLEVYESFSYSLINSSTPGLFLNQSKYGVEGGEIVLVNNTFYLFITEFTGDPRWIPSNLALWTTTMNDFPFGWVRSNTLYKSGGICDCNSSNRRASLGSSISTYYDNINDVWLIYYVGFESCCNDSYFYNRNGQIYLAQSTVKGINGITGPYEDVSVILKPDSNSQWWEGLKGIASFSNPYLINNTYYAFYGSALTQDTPCCNQRVGLVYSNSLYGPWIRSTNNPISLIFPNNYTEQPIMFRFNDNTFAALFDALNYEQFGDIGYTWSPDGIHWNYSCNQLLTVNPQNGKHWGKARTPDGLIAINETHFYAFFTGIDAIGNSKHESFGYSKVRFVQT